MPLILSDVVKQVFINKFPTCKKHDLSPVIDLLSNIHLFIFLFILLYICVYFAHQLGILWCKTTNISKHMFGMMYRLSHSHVNVFFFGHLWDKIIYVLGK